MRTIAPLPARVQTIDITAATPGELKEITHHLNTDGVLVDVYVKDLHDNRYHQITHHVEVALTKTKLYVKCSYSDFRVVITG